MVIRRIASDELHAESTAQRTKAGGEVRIHFGCREGVVISKSLGVIKKERKSCRYWKKNLVLESGATDMGSERQ